MRNIAKGRRTAKPNTKPPGNGASDPLVFVKNDELRTLGLDLDDLHSVLVGAGLNGDKEAFGHAEVVRQAADLVAELRLNVQA
jgi:hypothetical protein